MKGVRGKRRRRKTDDFDVVLSEILTSVDCAVLTLADRGTAEVVVQYDTSGVKVCGPALVHGVCDAHVCGGVKGRVAHDLKIGRVHRVGSIKRGGGVYMRGRERKRKETGACFTSQFNPRITASLSLLYYSTIQFGAHIHIDLPLSPLPSPVRPLSALLIEKRGEKNAREGKRPLIDILISSPPHPRKTIYANVYTPVQHEPHIPVQGTK